MRQLPNWIHPDLQPNLEIKWWGRRAAYEIVEEVSDAAFWCWIIVSLAAWWQPAWVVPIGYWIFISTLCLLASQHAIIEIGHWRNEIYIVAQDKINGGGRVYKFFGWLDRKHISEAIGVNSPAVIFDQTWWQRTWGFFTGEHMARVTLKSLNHTFIDGRRISPNLSRNINYIRGAAPSLKSGDSAKDLGSLSSIRQALTDGLIDKRKAREATTRIIDRHVWGV